MSKLSHQLYRGKIIHIGKLFKSFDNEDLNNRFMCIINTDDKYMYLLPMSSFDGKEHKKNYLLEKEENFEYSKKHGNKKDGYIKCNQIYKLDFLYINNNDEEIKIIGYMNKGRFENLKIKVKILIINNIDIIKIKEMNFYG